MEQFGQVSTVLQFLQTAYVWYPRRLSSRMDCLPSLRFSETARASAMLMSGLPR